MFANGPLNRCQQRKAALLQRSAAHRRALMTEAQTLRPAAGWVDMGIEVAGKARKGLNVLAPLLSLWRARKQEPSGVVHKLAEALSLARAVVGLWRSSR
jgi:hypothetical protein